MNQRKYYEAYDDRYRSVHQQGLSWFGTVHTQIVSDTIRKYGITRGMSLLELGCGEGRDASVLLGQGYPLLATDISREAVDYCRRTWPEYGDQFQVLNCIGAQCEDSYDFIYSVAVLHMLVEDEDRDGFYQFYARHLKKNGIGLICTMGDGIMERCSDIRTAFDLQVREHRGQQVMVTGTSCRMVSFDTLEKELARNGLRIVERGITSVEQEFSFLMYAVVK